eukprot:jgi/Mesvir1/24398/Mv11066-RA.1
MTSVARAAATLRTSARCHQPIRCADGQQVLESRCRNAHVGVRRGHAVVIPLSGDCQRFANVAMLRSCRGVEARRASYRGMCIMAVASTTTEKVAEGEVKVKFSMQRQAAFGQSFRVVGSHPALGSWNAAQGLKLEWSDGDIWVGEALLPEGEEVEYKYTLVNDAQGGAIASWSPGQNFLLTPQLPKRAVAQQGRGNLQLVVRDAWEGQPSGTTPAVEDLAGNELKESDLESSEGTEGKQAEAPAETPQAPKPAAASKVAPQTASTKPAAAAKPSASAKPSPPEKPAAPAKSEELAKPAASAAPATPAKPAAPASPVTPPPPVDPSESSSSKDQKAKSGALPVVEFVLIAAMAISAAAVYYAAPLHLPSAGAKSPAAAKPEITRMRSTG